MGVLVYSATTISTTLDEATADKSISKGITSYSIDRCFIVDDCWRCMVIYSKTKTFSIEAGCQKELPKTEDLIIIADKQFQYIAEEIPKEIPTIKYQEDKSFSRVDIDLTTAKTIVENKTEQIEGEIIP